MIIVKIVVSHLDFGQEVYHMCCAPPLPALFVCYGGTVVLTQGPGLPRQVLRVAQTLNVRFLCVFF
jgi:hypothetical protein